MTAQPLPDSSISLTYTTPESPPHLHHAPLPVPGPNQILVKIHAAAINPVDIQLWGNPLLGLLAGRREKGLGRDYAGTVAGIGSALRKSSQWQLGERVFGLCNRPTGEGTFAEYLCVTPASEPVAKMPQAWGFEEAAAVPLVVLTAFACLAWLPAETESPNGAARRVVVGGASGGVGMWVVQLAKVYGCHLTGVCSGKNAEFVRGLGADDVVDYNRQDVAETLLASRPEGRKYDLYVDCVGGTEMFEHWYDLLHKNAAYITIVGDKTSRTAMGGPFTYLTYPSQIWRHVYGFFFGPRYANVLLYQKSELLEQVAKLADEKGVQIVVQDVVKGILSEPGHVDAWDKVKGYMVEGRVRGKIVVSIP
ncbi:GroES-like protein [Didymella exigua CBS 183.55]|uniref:GroES-like protein n=1 Tax=Didymella exigua CBS 183.55 TaxID=1150837 RepID=A0A6A5RNT2_9PLEO|nr:GroES-like protein [Didymella exigua CBS 183.55]KAF1929083.1 GroES-like protein [Didymella exigua CBS 183.55]